MVVNLMQNCCRAIILNDISQFCNDTIITYLLRPRETVASGNNGGLVSTKHTVSRGLSK
jgi:hypothetical protein